MCDSVNTKLTVNGCDHQLGVRQLHERGIISASLDQFFVENGANARCRRVAFNPGIDHAKGVEELHRHVHAARQVAVEVLLQGARARVARARIPAQATHADRVEVTTLPLQTEMIALLKK